MSSVVRTAASRWAMERSISIFMELIQYGLFKATGQEREMRLYLLGMDFCHVKASGAKGGWFTSLDTV